MATMTGTGAVRPNELQTGASSAGSADRALNVSGVIWLSMALIGQWAFLYYIMSFYGSSVLSGDFATWNRLQALGAKPYVVGDTMGNLSFLAHALGAGIVAFSGVLQIIPQVRKHAPTFHRWNGRLFLTTCVALSISGLYLVWLRKTTPHNGQDFSTSLNALLILTSAFFTYHAARTRNLTAHRRWALRLYLVANAQWFLRVGVFAYFVSSRMIGHQAQLTDLFLRFWTYGCYLVPLVVLQLYMRAQRSRSSFIKGTMAGALVILTLGMTLGGFAFAMFSRLIVSGAPLKF